MLFKLNSCELVLGSPFSVQFSSMNVMLLYEYAVTPFTMPTISILGNRCVDSTMHIHKEARKMGFSIERVQHQKSCM